jgi:large subunit ribosomal protein L22
VSRNAARFSPRKLNLVARSSAARRSEKALADLTFSRKRIAGDVKKALDVGDRQRGKQP